MLMVKQEGLAQVVVAVAVVHRLVVELLIKVGQVEVLLLAARSHLAAVVVLILLVVMVVVLLRVLVVLVLQQVLQDHL